MYEARGALKLINDTQTFGSGFTKREFVVTTEDAKYPQDIKFEIVKDKCSLLDRFKVGQKVVVNFDIRGNEYNGRYYVNLNCWKIQAADAAGAPPQEEAPAGFDNPFGNEEEPSMDDLRGSGDDIPF